MRRQYSNSKNSNSRKTSSRSGNKSGSGSRNRGDFKKRNPEDDLDRDFKSRDEDSSYKKKFGKTFRGAQSPSSYKKDSKFGEFHNKHKDESKDSYRKYGSDKKARPKKQDNFDLDKGTRLNKYIANAGLCSRREADTYITAGLVAINGTIITELGVRVMPGDEVKFGNDRISPEKKVYILLNKPKGYVTTVDDPEERKTVMDLIRNACKERVVPVGRLDRNTTGLLLFTNDGDLTKKLTHPSYNKKKIYHVVTDMPITRDQLNQMVNGIELDDGLVTADAVSYVNDVKTEIGIELHSGRNRVVRRIIEHFGLNVVKLDRVYFAGLTKLNLPRGKWRFLSDREVANLKTGMYE